MTMKATVIAVQPGRLLVFDWAGRQRVVVHTPEAARFRPGCAVLIRFSGAMTMSIPPQISAISITPISGFGRRPCRRCL